MAETYAGQRLDNFLLRELKRVPRPLIYRLLRIGRIKVDHRRAKPDDRLVAGSRITLPALAVDQPRSIASAPAPPPILHECRHFIVIDKPAGLAVHGGSGISTGLIERLRLHRPADRLELAHRLDRETSGAIVVAKTRTGLTDLHAQLRAGLVRKRYVAAVFGKWKPGMSTVSAPLSKLEPAGPASRKAAVDLAEGRASTTRTRCRRQLRRGAVLDLVLETGRTHQARAHLAHVGLPIIGDGRYGDYAANREAAAAGLRRMLLHAWRMDFTAPDGEPIKVESPLPAIFAAAQAWLDRAA